MASTLIARSVALLVAVVAAAAPAVAQTTRAILRHVPAAAIDANGNRRVCFSQQSDSGLYILTVEARDRGRLAAGAIGVDESSLEAWGQNAERATIGADDASGWGWIEFNVSSPGCYRVGGFNARVRLYKMLVSLGGLP